MLRSDEVSQRIDREIRNRVQLVVGCIVTALFYSGLFWWVMR